MITRKLALLGAVAIAVANCSTLTAQVAAIPAPVPPPTTTLWNFLGIPQATNKIQAQLFNRRGNFPGLEKKPPLKKIADPANLLSDVPAIKAAAEIKQAEDLKPQKIKALKYLATIGCGCYDKDEKVTKALLAAMEDCTEEVRLEAVRAISLAASSERCSTCKQRSCCNEKIAAQLYKIAYELDDLGCYVETSERVREAAAQALGICCPSQVPLPEEATPMPEEGTTPPAPAEGTTPAEAAPVTPAVPATPQPATAAAQPNSTVDPNNFLRGASATKNVVPPGMSSSRRTAQARVTTVSTTGLAAASSGATGEIRLIDTHRNLIHVHLLPTAAPVPVGTRLRILSPRPEGMIVAGEAQVVETSVGAATMQPLGQIRVAEIVRGSVVVR